MIFNPFKKDAAPLRQARRGAWFGGRLRGRLRGKLLARFARDKSGVTAVEFGMVALPFLAIIVCIIEVAVDFLIFSQIDYATHKAAQEIRFGSVQARKLSAAQFKTDVLCPKVSRLSCSQVVVNAVVMRKIEDFYPWSTSSIDPATARWCPGNAADTVLLQVAYPVPLATMIWAGARSSANGVRYYLSAASFRNDPFALAISGTGC